MNGYALETSLETIADYFKAFAPDHNWTAKARVQPGQYAPILRFDPSEDLFTGGYRLELRRFGLVPQSFTSPTEADRYKKWFARADTWFYERNQGGLYNQRCLIPVSAYYTNREIAGVGMPCKVHHDDLKIFAVAGIWSDWQKPALDRVKSFAMFTIPIVPKDQSGPRTPILIEEKDWAAWLNPATRMGQVRRFLSPADPRKVDSVPLALERWLSQAA
jgi:putative SOS response-associated peptidase YedK